MTEPADDARLLKLSADGDQSAFGEVMDRHADAVHRLLVSLGAGPDDAEDALQDCFVSAWRSAGSFLGSGSARGWLFSIARNALRRQHRRRAGEPARIESLEALGAEAGWGRVTDFTHEFEVREALQWALDQLPSPEREAVVLRDLEGFSAIEAAEIVGSTEAALKSRLHRGRLRLMGVARREHVNG